MSALGDDAAMPVQGEYAPRGWTRERVILFRREIARPGASYDSVGRLMGFSNTSAWKVARRLGVKTDGAGWKLKVWVTRAAVLLYDEGYLLDDIADVMGSKSALRTLASHLSQNSSGARLERARGLGRGGRRRDQGHIKTMAPSRKARLKQIFDTKKFKALLDAVRADLEGPAT